MTREAVAQLWKARMHDFRTSRESVTDWCKRHQVSRAQFYRWMRRLKGSEADQPAVATSRPHWVALTVKEPAPGPSTTPPIVVRVGAIAVEVQRGFDPGVLAEVLQTVKALC